MNWSLADKWGWFWGEAAWPTRVLDIGHTFRFSVSLSLFITWVPDSGMGFAWISCTAVEQPCSPALSGHNPVDVLSVCRLSFSNVGGAAFPPMWREQRGTFSSSQTLFCSLPSVYSTVTRKQEQMRCWGTTDAHANPDKTRNNLTTDSVKNDQVRWIPWAWKARVEFTKQPKLNFSPWTREIFVLFSAWTPANPLPPWWVIHGFPHRHLRLSGLFTRLLALHAGSCCSRPIEQHRPSQILTGSRCPWNHIWKGPIVTVHKIPTNEDVWTHHD